VRAVKRDVETGAFPAPPLPSKNTGKVNFLKFFGYRCRYLDACPTQPNRTALVRFYAYKTSIYINVVLEKNPSSDVFNLFGLTALYDVTHHMSTIKK
jgi:hypothetical protein